jgi:hypothetical protein
MAVTSPQTNFTRWRAIFTNSIVRNTTTAGSSLSFRSFSRVLTFLSPLAASWTKQSDGNVGTLGYPTHCLTSS